MKDTVKKPIGKLLRNLLIRQPETIMLARNKCIYFSEVYTFQPLTDDECQTFVLEVQKIVSPPTFIEKLKELLSI